ncbi:G5 domain-containing protein [Nosocomiicoccus massiliensis]|uniref:G5 domain-containing protein n=1 Tax=Nosocomiicoccus massiliensis TaxID=1232430 RepID=A0AAF1BN97_9STAP|nr:G5 domain-containing protein [Nosocomiicoccus massiliensis]WOS96005.1 G5 domain-containing protein [Nosocomiicoccus massiliensis]
MKKKKHLGKITLISMAGFLTYTYGSEAQASEVDSHSEFTNDEEISHDLNEPKIEMVEVELLNLNNDLEVEAEPENDSVEEDLKLETEKAETVNNDFEDQLETEQAAIQVEAEIEDVDLEVEFESDKEVIKEKETVTIDDFSSEELLESSHDLNNHISSEETFSTMNIDESSTNEIDAEDETSLFNGEELSRVLINVEEQDAVKEINVVGTFDPTKVDDMTNGYTNTLMLIDSKTLKTIANISFIGKTFDNRLEDFINDFNNENGTLYKYQNKQLISRSGSSTTIGGITRGSYQYKYNVYLLNESDTVISDNDKPLVPSYVLYDNTDRRRTLKSITIKDEYNNKLYSNENLINYMTVDEVIKEALGMLDESKYYYDYLDVSSGFTSIVSNFGSFRGTSYDIEVYVGTKKNTETTSTTEVVEIPYDIIIRYDDNVAKGEIIVEQEGRTGLEEVTTHTTYENGHIIDEYKDHVIIREPIDRIEIHGNKVVQNFERTEVEEIPYNIILEESDELEVGQRVLKQKGINGSITSIYLITTINGVETSNELIETLYVDSIDEIYLIGTKVVIPDEPETPGETEEPSEPVVPDEPKTPGETEEPSEPVVPDEPKTPGETEEPSEPVVPDEPKTPGETEEPSEPVVPDEPKTPGETEEPSEPVVPEESETPDETEELSKPVDTDRSEVPTDSEKSTESDNFVMYEDFTENINEVMQAEEISVSKKDNKVNEVNPTSNINTANESMETLPNTGQVQNNTALAGVATMFAGLLALIGVRRRKTEK